MKIKFTIRRCESFVLCQTISCSNIFNPPVVRPPRSVLCHHSLLFSRPVSLSGSRFEKLIDAQHNSCPGKHWTYFHHRRVLPAPVRQTAASNHKHICTLTCTQAHSENTSLILCGFLLKACAPRFHLISLWWIHKFQFNKVYRLHWHNHWNWRFTQRGKSNNDAHTTAL